MEEKRGVRKCVARSNKVVIKRVGVKESESKRGWENELERVGVRLRWGERVGMTELEWEKEG